MTNPIVTLAEQKVYSGITNVNSDAFLNMLLVDTLSAIGSLCNRKFESTNFIETFNGNGRNRIQLPNYPITKVNSLVISGLTIPASQKTGNLWSNGYRFVAGSRNLLLEGYTFTKGDANVEVDYVAGYGDASGLNQVDIAPWPADLKLAFMMYVQTRFKERDRIGVGSVSLAGQSVTYTDDTSGTGGKSAGIPSAALGVFKNYMNVVPVIGV